MGNALPLKLGIVGGLGAHAGADILNRLVQMTPVRSEGDHREIIFEQHPLREEISPDSQDYIPTHRKFYVFETLYRMQERGCDAALLPCFITHTFLNELESELNIRLISMMQAISRYLESQGDGLNTLGVFTTPYVRKCRSFERLLGDRFDLIYPSPEKDSAALNAIYGENGFKAGHLNPRVFHPISEAFAELADRGADLIVPGLTEIPLLMEHIAVLKGLTVLNTAELYADHALRETRGNLDAPFKVGVVGGVGPAATVDFLEKVVNETNAERDQDHIKVLIEQNPQIPDRTENLIGNGADPSIALYSTCKKLENGGAKIIVIPCNTAHAYLERLQRHLNVPVVSILDTTVDHIAGEFPDISHVGVLATDGTIGTGLYQGALESANLMAITPDGDHQAVVMDAIYGPEGVKAGHVTGKSTEQLSAAISHLVQRGAECVILGCTELPLLAENLESDSVPILIDPTRILARKCVDLALGDK